MAGLLVGAIAGGISVGRDKFKSRKQQKSRANELDDEIPSSDVHEFYAPAAGSSPSPRLSRTGRSKSENVVSTTDNLEDHQLHERRSIDGALGDDFGVDGSDDEEELPPPYHGQHRAPSYDEATGSSSRGDRPIAIRSRADREAEKERKRKEFLKPSPKNVFDLMGQSMAMYHGAGVTKTKQFKYWDDDMMQKETARRQAKKDQKKEAAQRASMGEPPKYDPDHKEG